MYSALEELQLYLFLPIVLLFYFSFRRFKHIALPFKLCLLMALVGLLAAASIRGLISFSGGRGRLLIADLGLGIDDKSYRELVNRQKEIAKAYNLPLPEVLLRHFSSSEEAVLWHDSTHPAAVLLSGNADWYRVNIPGSGFSLLRQLSQQQTKEPSLSKAELAAWGLSAAQPLEELTLPGYPSSLLLVYAPESLGLPAEPKELARHYLAWLSAATLAPLETKGDFAASLSAGNLSKELKPQLALARMEDAWSQAENLTGQWKTPEPLLFARVALSNIYLQQYIRNFSAANSAALDYIVSDLSRSLRMLRKADALELQAVIRNSLALTRVLQAKEEEDFVKARREFLQAAALTNSQGRPTLGAKVALFNLRQLEKDGVL